MFNLNNDKALRKELEIDLNFMTHNAFRGTVTTQEA
jgi:hypothetical protein